MFKKILSTVTCVSLSLTLLNIGAASAEISEDAEIKGLMPSYAAVEQMDKLLAGAATDNDYLQRRKKLIDEYAPYGYAYESFEGYKTYGSIGSGGVNFGMTFNDGAGWSSNGGTTAASGAITDGKRNTEGSILDTTNKAFYMQGGTGSFFRDLNAPIDFSKDGEYFIAIDIQPNAGNIHNLVLTVGDNICSFGMAQDSGTYTLKLNDAAPLTTTDVKKNVWNRLILHIAASEADNDKFELYAWQRDSASMPDIPQLTDEQEINISDAVKINVANNGYNTEIDNIKVECYNNTFNKVFVPSKLHEDICNAESITYIEDSIVDKLPDLSAAKDYYTALYKKVLDEYYAKIANGEESTEADIRKEFVFLGNFASEYSDYADKVNELKLVAQELGFDEAAASIIQSSAPVDKSIVYSGDVNEIKIAYDFNLAGTAFTVKQGENTLSSNTMIDGKNVTITLNDAIEKGIECRVLPEDVTDYKGDAVPQISFTISALPVVNIVDGGIYTQGEEIIWNTEGALTDVFTLTTPKGTSQIESGYVLSDVGECELHIAIYSEEALVEENTVSFVVKGATKATAEDVRIKKSLTDGMLTGQYIWKSNNENENEKDSVYIWYRSLSEDKNGEYEEVKRGITDDCLTYLPSSQEINRWFCFAVIPCSDSPSMPVGDEAKSTPYPGEFAPTATELKLDGKIAADEVVTAVYKYKDENAENIETDSTVRWYVVNEADGSETEVTADAITKTTIKITDNMFDKKLCFSVTPKSNKAPVEGNEVKSDMYIMPAKPYITTITLEGTPNVGKTLTAVYDYTDVNIDTEGNSVIEWRYSGTDELIYTGRTISLGNAHKGKSIYAEVKPVSVNIPYEGIALKSAPVTIGEYSPSSSGGGSGGGGGGYKNTQLYSGKESGSEEKKENTPPLPTQQPSAAQGFGDIDLHWAKDYITKLESLGIVKSDSFYRPEDSVTRAELIAMIVRSKNGETKEYTASFSDVAESDWYASAIQYALEEGIISLDTYFRPNDAVTREEAAKMLCALLGEITGTQVEFSDRENVSDWAVEYVNTASAAGIFKGDEKGCFNPSKQLTRAEAAAVIARVIEQIAGGIN